MKSSSVAVEWSELFSTTLDDELIDLWRAVEQRHGVSAAAMSATARTFMATYPDRALRIVDVVSEVDTVHDVDVGAVIMTLSQTQSLDEWAPTIRHNPQRVQLLGALRALGIRIAIVSESVWSRAWVGAFLARDQVPHDALVIANEGNWNLAHPDAWQDGITRIGPGVAICADRRKASGALASGLMVTDWAWVHRTVGAAESAIG